MKRVEAGMEVEPQEGTITYPPEPPPTPGPGGTTRPTATNPAGGSPAVGAKGGKK
jgi:hypothetical protein